MRILHLKHPRLQIDEFTPRLGEFWCLYGAGHSGLDAFLALLEGGLTEAEAEAIHLPETPEIVSPARQQRIYEDELYNDDSDFLDRCDPGTPARDFLPADSLDTPLIDEFAMREALDTGYRQLSSGQSRKLLLLQALLGGASTIVIDSPYDGLDHTACLELDHAFSRLTRPDLRLFVLVRNHEDIPGWCSHLGIFAYGKLVHNGTMEEGLPKLPQLTTSSTMPFQLAVRPERLSPTGKDHDVPGQELVRLRRGYAGYGEKTLFTDLDLTVIRGSHTLVTGPNGCGKSTLLQLITGDNPKCYVNDLRLFGRKRGSGESIWEIKRHMGIVSPELHRSYRVPGSALQVVLSGLFDTIGLYQRPSERQLTLARQWLAAIDLERDATTAFRQLSYGDQRLVLIARALIKFPPLLILDEPTQGLDGDGRRGLLDFLEKVAADDITTILYVSHRQDEFRAFYRQHIRLETFGRKN